MSDGSILVTFESVMQASQDCSTINGQLTQELADLKTYLGPLIASWTGRAAEDYQALQRQWDTSADDLSQLLAEISRSLQIAGDNYRQTEQANSSIWAG